MNNHEFQKTVRNTLYNIEDTLLNIRRITNGLSTVKLENHGLVNSIKEMKTIVEKAGVVKVNLKCDFDEQIINAFSARNIYWIISELLHNSIKHSKCKMISISIHDRNKKLFIIYDDDGEVINNKPISSDGIGIRNITERIRLLHGKINSIDCFENGTHFHFTIDIKAVNNQSLS
jgi:signal transduction histidine kinase